MNFIMGVILGMGSGLELLAFGDHFSDYLADCGVVNAQKIRNLHQRVAMFNVGLVNPFISNVFG